MKPLPFTVRYLVVAASVVLVPGVHVGLTARAATSPVRIQLKEQASVSASLVTIADVAEVTPANSPVSQLIGALDIAEMSPETNTVTVQDSQINLRLQLAGLEPNAYVIVGATEATVLRVTERVNEQVNDERVLEVIRSPLAEIWNVDATSLQLRLSQPLPTAATALPALNDYRLKPFLRSTLVPGPLRIRVGLYNQQELIQSFAVSIDAAIERSVPVAKSNLRPGHAITAADFQMERRQLTGRDALQVADDVVQRVASRLIRVGQPIRTIDVYSAGYKGTRPPKTPAVKRNSVVQLVAKKSGLRVTVPNGILLQDARVGDAVSVRNATSEKTVVGRLISPTQVEVSF